jgi:C-terminal processing protease CtpA/Prc
MKIVAVDGSVVDGSDLVRVRRLLQGAPGTRVRLQLVDGSTRQLTLRQYL